MNENNYSAIDARMLMELAAVKTTLDAIIGLLQAKKKMFNGLTYDEVKMVLDMFCEKGEDDA